MQLYAATQSCTQAAFFSALEAERKLSCFYTLTESFPPETEEPWEGSERALTSYEGAFISHVLSSQEAGFVLQHWHTSVYVCVCPVCVFVF